MRKLKLKNAILTNCETLSQGNYRLTFKGELNGYIQLYKVSFDTTLEVYQSQSKQDKINTLLTRLKNQEMCNIWDIGNNVRFIFKKV